MNKNIIIGVLVVIILVVGGYFIFIKQGSPPAGNQPEQADLVAFTDPTSFAPSFLQCSPSELKMPFPGNNTYISSMFGIENGKCHYTLKVVDQKGVTLAENDCKVPKELISEDILGHVFGNDKAPGKEKVLAEQNKIEADYCIKLGQ